MHYEHRKLVMPPQQNTLYLENKKNIQLNIIGERQVSMVKYKTSSIGISMLPILYNIILY